jgi:hypothetical protein
MSTAISRRYFSFHEESNESKEYQTAQERDSKVARILVLDARDIRDAAVTAIASAWAHHSAVANGFGD